MNLPSEYQDFAEGHESIKAKVNAIRGKLVQQVQFLVTFHQKNTRYLDKL